MSCWSRPRFGISRSVSVSVSLTPSCVQASMRAARELEAGTRRLEAGGWSAAADRAKSSIVVARAALAWVAESPTERLEEF